MGNNTLNFKLIRYKIWQYPRPPITQAFLDVSNECSIIIGARSPRLVNITCLVICVLLLHLWLNIEMTVVLFNNWLYIGLYVCCRRHSLHENC